MADAPRRFPPPWRAEPISGGYVVRDATGQARAYARPKNNRARPSGPDRRSHQLEVFSELVFGCLLAEPITREPSLVTMNVLIILLNVDYVPNGSAEIVFPNGICKIINVMPFSRVIKVQSLPIMSNPVLGIVVTFRVGDGVSGHGCAG
jgi:hypothetical protein